MRSTTNIMVDGKIRIIDLTQAALLNAALRREDGALLPAPDFVPHDPAHLDTAIASLVRRGLARMEGEVACITQLGVNAMVQTDPHGGPATLPHKVDSPQPAGAPEQPTERSAPSAIRPRKPGKLDLIATMLTTPSGATLEELTRATGWLPHSVRAGMTGLRKQGHSIARTSVDGVIRFAITDQPAVSDAA